MSTGAYALVFYHHSAAKGRGYIDLPSNDGGALDFRNAWSALGEIRAEMTLRNYDNDEGCLDEAAAPIGACRIEMMRRGLRQSRRWSAQSGTVMHLHNLVRRQPELRRLGLAHG